MRLALRAAVVCLMALLIGAATLSAADAATAACPLSSPNRQSLRPRPRRRRKSRRCSICWPTPRCRRGSHSRIKPNPLPRADKPSLEFPQQVMATHVEAVREHLSGMVEVMPDMPAQFVHAADVFHAKLGNRRPERILGLVIAFRGTGFWRRGAVLAGNQADPTASRSCIQWKPSATACVSSPSVRPLRWAW